MVTKVQMLNTKIAELNSKIIELGKIQKVTTDCVHDYYKDNSLVSWETLSSHIVGQWVSAGKECYIEDYHRIRINYFLKPTSKQTQ